MRKVILLCVSLFTMVLVLSSPVRAQNVLWVSNTGNDAILVAQQPRAQGAINKGNVVQINCLTSSTYGLGRRPVSGPLEEVTRGRVS